jgi:DNA helicase-2/ATP-dependent DNA helicase PcrA
MDSFEPIRKAAEDLHHQVAGNGMPKKPMALIPEGGPRRF